MSDSREVTLAKRKKWRSENPEDGKKWYAILKQNKPVYTVYNNMISRCCNPKNDKYYKYGAKGITVCERWRGKDGYVNFEADMGPRPSPQHSIDRKDNDGNYEPTNCRWATKKEQQRNRSVNVNVTINGKTQCIMAWAEELGMTYSTFLGRVQRGWTGDKLLSPPDQAYNLNQEYITRIKKKS